MSAEDKKNNVKLRSMQRIITLVEQGLHVLVQIFPNVHTLCMRAAMALTRLRLYNL